MPKSAKKKKQPTQRSLEYLRKLGYTVAVVERWNPHTNTRHDLFGCIDILCLPDSSWRAGDRVTGCWGFQVTSAANLAARRTKALQEPRLRLWLQAGGRFFLHAWLKSKKSGRWEVREEEITLEQLGDGK